MRLLCVYEVTLVAFQILSLSGGGFLGLYSLTVLEALEQEAGVPIASCFDLIAGTSVGGIIALALAAEVPVRDIKELFEKKGTAIFSPRGAPRSTWGKFRDVLRSMFGAKYKAANLREVIESILGDRTLAALKHPTLVPAVNLTTGYPQIFKTPHHHTFRRDHRLRAVDVALATSAAPTYFPVARIGDELFADGGLIANSPDLLAVHEAEQFFAQNVAEVSMLSIGTTSAKFTLSHRIGLDMGIIKWAMGQRLVNTTIAAQQSLAMFMVQHRLKERLVRIDVAQSKEQQGDLALDVADPTAQDTLRALGESSVRNNINSPSLRQMLMHRAPPPAWPGLTGEVS